MEANSHLEAPSALLSGKPPLPFDDMAVSDPKPTSRLWRRETTITLAGNRIPKHPTISISHFSRTHVTV